MMCMYRPKFHPDQCVDALRTSFGPGKQRISSIYGQLYISDAMYRMDGPMICFDMINSMHLTGNGVSVIVISNTSISDTSHSWSMVGLHSSTIKLDNLCKYRSDSVRYRRKPLDSVLVMNV